MIIERRKGIVRDTLVLFEDTAVVGSIHKGFFDRMTLMRYSEVSIPAFLLTQKKQTAVIDLSGPIEGVLHSFNDTAQKKISRTMRYEGFRFEMSGYPFPPEVRELYVEFERGRGRVPFSVEAFRECLAFFVYDKDVLVSGAFVYPTSPVARARSFFSRRRIVQDHEVYKRVSYASNRVIFEICRWAKEKERNGFDLGPVNMLDEKKSGITNFKLSFNPRLMPEYTYVRSSFAYSVLEVSVGFLRRIQQLFMRVGGFQEGKVYSKSKSTPER